MSKEAVIGFKTAIVTSNNVAPSILWLLFTGMGAGENGGGGHCVAFCEGIDN